MIYLIIFAILMFCLQYFFTYLQMNSFRKYFTEFIKKGKVAIGIKKGAIVEGAIIMFLVDEIGNIKDCAYINGVSTFSRFKKEDKYNNVNILDLDKTILDKLKIQKSLKLAILNARDNFIKAKNGEEIPMEKSPFQKIISRFKLR